MTVLAVVMGETLDVGTGLIELLGQHMVVTMDDVYQANDVLLDAVGDREVTRDDQARRDRRDLAFELSGFVIPLDSLGAIAFFGLFMALCENAAVAAVLAQSSNVKHAMLGEPLLF
ncbi:hypothetical protein [Novosphingobium sp. BL-52-GroH]|uniref:hypothetical protein n=1 Tax=Novosphingobium sp. BL-52-GroH TaxID=3349877 RepID=UPI00384E69FA